MMHTALKIVCYQKKKKGQFTQLQLLGIGRAQDGAKLLRIPSQDHLLATVHAAVDVHQACYGHQALWLCRLTGLVNEHVCEVIMGKLS